MNRYQFNDWFRKNRTTIACLGTAFLGWFLSKQSGKKMYDLGYEEGKRSGKIEQAVVDVIHIAEETNKK